MIKLLTDITHVTGWLAGVFGACVSVLVLHDGAADGLRLVWAILVLTMLGIRTLAYAGLWVIKQAAVTSK